MIDRLIDWSERKVGMFNCSQSKILSCYLKFPTVFNSKAIWYVQQYDSNLKQPFTPLAKMKSHRLIDLRIFSLDFPFAKLHYHICTGVKTLACQCFSFIANLTPAPRHMVSKSTKSKKCSFCKNVFTWAHGVTDCRWSGSEIKKIAHQHYWFNRLLNLQYSHFCLPFLVIICVNKTLKTQTKCSLSTNTI